MKAIVQDSYGPPEVLQFADIENPTVKANEVLVRVHAAGVDPGVWHLMAGLPYLVRLMGYGVRTPKVRIRGRDVAGRVEAVGAEVTGFRQGDEVFGICEGSFAEYACVRTDRLLIKPERLTFEQAAAVPISALTALHALRAGGPVRPDQRVLVIGAAGGVGTFTVQLAKSFGAHVTGVCSTTKTELVRSIGADEVIDYTKEELGARSDRYDVVIDTAGNRPLRQLRQVMTRRAVLVIVGSETGGRWLGGIDRLLRALLLSPFVSQKLRGVISGEGAADLQAVRQLVEDGRITPIIDRTYPLDQAAQAIHHVQQGRARGKVVLTV